MSKVEIIAANLSKLSDMERDQLLAKHGFEPQERGGGWWSIAVPNGAICCRESFELTLADALIENARVAAQRVFGMLEKMAFG